MSECFEVRHMKKTRRFLVAIVIIAGVVAAAIILPRQHVAPALCYRGRPLSVWLEGYGASRARAATPCTETDEAVRHIGTNAIEFLLSLLHTEDSVTKSFLISRGELLLGHGSLGCVGLTSAETGYWRAAKAFAALGESGECAIPDLVDLALGTNAPHSPARGYAADSLVAIGADSVPPLVKALASENTVVRDVAACALGRIGPGAESAVPALLDLLKCPSDNNRVNAAAALGLIGKRPALVVPALAEALRDPYWNVRSWAADALGEIGKEPDIAVPALIHAINDTNEHVRVIVIAALGQFGPDAKAALPNLIPIADNDKSQKVRDWASCAIEKIDAKHKGERARK